MSVIIIENGLVHYEALGRGKPLVLIHGWVGSWRYWVPAMDDLSDRYRTYALDLWGFGDSDRRRDGYSLPGYVSLVRQFMDELGLWAAPLIGHALGGVVALGLAALAPERVEQVVAVSLPVNGSTIGRSLTGFSGNSRDIAARILGRRQSGTYTEVQLEADKADAAAITSSVQAVLRVDLRETLQRVRAPTLLIYGQDDPLISAPAEEWQARLDDNVHTVLLEHSRHFPMLDEANKFNRVLRGFLETGGDFSALEIKDEWRRRWR
jgi:pimeloyl-ACP methyl ester carboxylesterase